MDKDDTDSISSAPDLAYQAIHPVVLVMRKPRPSAARDTELLYGDMFEVQHISRGWAKGFVKGQDNYTGYVQLRSISDTYQKPSHRVRVLEAPVFRYANIKSQIMSILPMNACVNGAAKGEFLKISGGYMHKQHVIELSSYSTHVDYVDIAEKHIGRPYVWGGISARGLDCSGLVLSSLRAVGQHFPRDSGPQSKQGKAVDHIDNLRRGDLVFWAGHVGIMQSKTQLLHANAHHMCVASESLSEAIDRINKSAGPITALRRII